MGRDEFEHSYTREGANSSLGEVNMAPKPKILVPAPKSKLAVEPENHIPLSIHPTYEKVQGEGTQSRSFL